MEKEKTVFPIIAAMILLLTACSVIPETFHPAQKTVIRPSQTPTITYTPSTTNTLTITPTPTVTATATITPTPTPPPDLELTNVTIYPDTFNVATQQYYLMGRIRNNTNTTMILYDDKIAFKFTFETWEFDEQMKILQDQEYFHIIFKEDIEVGWDYYRVMNCILYPGEEGVIDIGVTVLGIGVERTLYEHTPVYKGPLGIWYTYQSFYDTKPDLPTGFHYKAENVTMQKENGGIVFDFDLDVLNNLLYPDWISEHPTWVIIYDKDGKIVDILYKDLAHYYPGFYVGKRLHVHYSTADTVSQKYFRPLIEVTPEIAGRADHIEVLSELNETLVCSRYLQK